MSVTASFKLEIFTPEKQFFSGEVESVVLDSFDGELGILAGHYPMTAAVASGEIKMKINGEWKSAFNSEGFVEVRPDEVLLFAHSCEWPEDIDEARAKAEYERETKQLRNAESLLEHQSAEIALRRITAMLRVKNHSKFNG